MATVQGEYLGIYTQGWFSSLSAEDITPISVGTQGWFDVLSAVNVIVIPGTPGLELSAWDATVSVSVIASPSASTLELSAWSPAVATGTGLSNLQLELDIFTPTVIAIVNPDPDIDFDAMPNGWITKCRGENYNNERELYQVLQMEAYNMLGTPMEFYEASYDVNYDKVWGEDNNRQFVRKYDVMAFYNLPREEKLWTKLGIEGIDTFSMHINKEHFSWVTSAESGSAYIPKVADVIKAKYNEYYYEITEVKEESMMNLLSKQYSWNLIVAPFKDEHIITSAGLLYKDPISDYTDKPNDIYDNTSAVNDEKIPVLYTSASNECPPDNPFGQW